MKFCVIFDADDHEFSKIVDASKHYFKFIGGKFGSECILYFDLSASWIKMVYFIVNVY